MATRVPSFQKISAAVILSIISVGAYAPFAHADTSSGTLEYTGWLPYWATDKGIPDASSHLSQITELNPFGYSVKTNGQLSDTANLGSSAWQSLLSSARSQNVLVVPTIMWSDTANIYAVLNDPVQRAAHIQSIVSTVTQGNFDGIDIDYEGKTAETRPGFSAFLSELSAALYAANPKLKLDCTIEARMPLSARYSGTPPANIEYANDLPTINKVCDRVRLMTYDQQTADVQLNASHSSTLYAPVADSAWVEKVVNYMAQDIDRSKILIGVATYGAEYQAMSNADGSGFTYTKISSFNPQYGIDTANQYGITPTRNASGELSISYVPKEQTTALLPSQSTLASYAPSGTDTASAAAVGALQYSKQQGKQAPVTFLTWSDAQAIQDKAKLAQKLGVSGIALFKIDGGEDQSLWNLLSNVASATKKPSTSRNVTNVTPVSTVTATTTTTVSSTTSTTATTTPVITAPPATPPVSVTTTQTSFSFKKDLQYGNENADVKRLQSILIKKGYLKVAANGYFGPATKAAVKTWQKAAGLPSTGYFGPQSRAKIGS